MANFSLLKDLEKEQSTPNKSGIAYQTYDLPVSGKIERVLIPIRECNNFETSLEEFEELDGHSLKQLLRKFRGLRDNK